MRGTLTFEEVNDLIPTDIVDAPRVDAVMDFLGDNDIEVEENVKAKGADDGDDDDQPGEELDDFLKRKQKEEEASVRSIDPVKLYLRKMGSVSLLTREGEVEIAKRIEKGEEQIVAALLSCQLGVDSILGLSQKVQDGQIRVKDMIRGVKALGLETCMTAPHGIHERAQEPARSLQKSESGLPRSQDHLER